MNPIIDIIIGLAIGGFLLYLRKKLTGIPKHDPFGKWYTEVKLISSEQGSYPIFRKRYKTSVQAELAGQRYCKKIRKTLQKKYGVGQHEGSIRHNSDTFFLDYSTGVSEARKQRDLTPIHLKNITL